MNARSFEFIVAGLVQVEHFTVMGRCGDEPIRVGDRFDAAYRYEPRKYPEEFGDEPVREEEKPVSLRVFCIHAYGRSLDALGEGMTGSLVLQGDGLDQIEPGWVLGRRGEGTTERERVVELSQAR